MERHASPWGNDPTLAARCIPHYCGILVFPYTPPVPYCYQAGPNERCDDWIGRMKYVIRPNLVGSALTVHQCPGQRSVLLTQEAHFKEYRGHLSHVSGPVRCADVPSFPQPGDDSSIPWYRQAHRTDVLVQDRDLPEFMKARLPSRQWANYNTCKCSNKRL